MLTLTTLRCPDVVAPETRTASGGEFSIGRGPENDWVLPDPDRHLSKRHCVLLYRAGGWQLSDLSANGTFLNREANPVGSGAPRSLRDGDRLSFGPYEIEVAIAAAPQPLQRGSPPMAADPFAEPPQRDPFAPDPFDRDPPTSGPEQTCAESLLPSSDLLRDDFLGPIGSPMPGRTEHGFHGPTQDDHSPATDAAFHPPPRRAAAIMDDWDLDAPAAPPAGSGRVKQPGMPAPLPTPPAAAPPAAADRPDPVAAASDGALLAAFLRGAGLPDARLSDPARTLEGAGAALRAVVSGLRGALIARAAIKGEFRIEQTMVRAKGNNPLKFSADDDDALAALLGAGRHGGVAPAAAVADALRDMRLHEIACSAAMQSAVRALLAEVAPDGLERQGGGGRLPLQRKARAWDAFEAMHARVMHALSDDFDSVFGKAFARAYEQALLDAEAQDRRAAKDHS